MTVETHTDRTRALALLDKLTATFVEARPVRGKYLLPTSDAEVGFGHTFGAIGEGWAFKIERSHFDCLDTKLTERITKTRVLLPKAQADDALKAKTAKKMKGAELPAEPGMVEVEISQKRQEWTQGSTFSIGDGYTFYGTDEAHPVCIQIRKAVSSTPAVAVNKALPEKPVDAERSIHEAEQAGGSGELRHNPKSKKAPYELCLRYPRDPGKVIFAVYRPGTDRLWEQERVVEVTMDGFVRILIEGIKNNVEVSHVF